MVDWAAAADRCQLSELRLRCLSAPARRLACGSSSLTSTFAEAALVAQCCSKSTLTELLALAMAAGQAASPEKFADSLPAPGAAAAALQQAANPGSFEWALERYSEQPAGMGQAVFSPWFSAAGKEWRLEVYPGSKATAWEGHLSGEAGACIISPCAVTLLS